jgi:hypothetical protein
MCGEYGVVFLSARKILIEATMPLIINLKSRSVKMNVIKSLLTLIILSTVMFCSCEITAAVYVGDEKIAPVEVEEQKPSYRPGTYPSTLLAFEQLQKAVVELEKENSVLK